MILVEASDKGAGCPRIGIGVLMPALVDFAGDHPTAEGRHQAYSELLY